MRCMYMYVSHGFANPPKTVFTFKYKNTVSIFKYWRSCKMQTCPLCPMRGEILLSDRQYFKYDMQFALYSRPYILPTELLLLFLFHWFYLFLVCFDWSSVVPQDSLQDQLYFYVCVFFLFFNVFVSNNKPMDRIALILISLLYISTNCNIPASV